MTLEELLNEVNRLKFEFYELKEAFEKTPHRPFIQSVIDHIGDLQRSINVDLHPDPESTKEE